MIGAQSRSCKASRCYRNTPSSYRPSTEEPRVPTRQDRSERLLTYVGAHPPSKPPTSAASKAAVNGAPAGTFKAAEADAHIPDKARVRRLADRAARGYEDAAWLPRQVADGLMEHLAPVRIAPARILDAGAGTGICSRLLARRFPGARILALDSSTPMLRNARGLTRRWFSKHAYACGDAESLPVADRSVDLVVSSLMLPSCGSPDAVLSDLCARQSRRQRE